MVKAQSIQSDLGQERERLFECCKYLRYRTNGFVVEYAGIYRFRVEGFSYVGFYLVYIVEGGQGLMYLAPKTRTYWGLAGNK